VFTDVYSYGISMKQLISGLVLSLVILCTGCAPQLGVRLPVPTVTDPVESERSEGRGDPVRVRVGTFMDTRTDDTLAVIDGRQLSPDGSVAGAVQEGLERYLRTAGANVVLFNAPSVEGEIVSWRVQIAPSFPATEATAVAKIKLEVRGEGARVLYRASYSGEATSKHPFPNEASIRKLLGDAMGSALEEVINDTSFVASLSRVSR
jgi:hypothetical protein